MLHTYIAYCPKDVNGGRDLGYAYNAFMEYIKEDDWVCFLDHDAVFTTSHWYHQICEVIASNPDAGEFSAMTNRIGNPSQKLSTNQYPGIDASHDISTHRKVGKILSTEFWSEVEEFSDMSRGLSGVLLVTSKASWRKVGGFRSGFLGVDWDYTAACRNKGLKTYIMMGVYLYHWYRGDGDTSHLSDSAGGL